MGGAGRDRHARAGGRHGRTRIGDTSPGRVEYEGGSGAVAPGHIAGTRSPATQSCARCPYVELSKGPPQRTDSKCGARAGVVRPGIFGARRDQPSDLVAWRPGARGRVDAAFRVRPARARVTQPASFRLPRPGGSGSLDVGDAGSHRWFSKVL